MLKILDRGKATSLESSEDVVASSYQCLVDIVAMMLCHTISHNVLTLCMPSDQNPVVATVPFNAPPSNCFRLGGGSNDYKDVVGHAFFSSINFDDLMAKKVWQLFLSRE